MTVDIIKPATADGLVYGHQAISSGRFDLIICKYCFSIAYRSNEMWSQHDTVAVLRSKVNSSEPSDAYHIVPIRSALPNRSASTSRCLNFLLTHWGWVTHICVCKLTNIGSYNGLSPDRRQAIIWTNAWLLLIGPLGTNFSEILIEILIFSFKKTRLKVSSVKQRPFCLGLNVLTSVIQ